MTVTVTGQRVPASKFQQFHDILCATGGRYLGSPTQIGDVVLASYQTDDYVGMNEAWNRCTRAIREVRKDQTWRVVLRRLGFKA